MKNVPLHVSVKEALVVLGDNVDLEKLVVNDQHNVLRGRREGGVDETIASCLRDTGHTDQLCVLVHTKRAAPGHLHWDVLSIIIQQQTKTILAHASIRRCCRENMLTAK